MNIKRFSMIKKVLCMVAFAMLISSPAFAITIDGNVRGFDEGYTSGFEVSFNIENGPSGVTGGSLFRAEDDDFMYFGLILPLNIVDNTYGANKASDWEDIEHYLWGGGEGLEGSDGWKFEVKDVYKLELDYIVGESDNNPSPWSALIKKSEGVNTLEFHTSLDYNYTKHPQFFGPEPDPKPKDGGIPIDSPPSTPTGSYNFDSPAEDWIPEIMYEFSIETGTFSNNWIDLFNSSEIHASPNKYKPEAGNKVYPKLGDPITPVPEPTTLLLLGSGLIGLVGFRRKFRRG